MSIESRIQKEAEKRFSADYQDTDKRMKMVNELPISVIIEWAKSFNGTYSIYQATSNSFCGLHDIVKGYLLHKYIDEVEKEFWEKTMSA